MRFGIRKKLLLAFVLVTVLPVVVFFISIGLLVSQLDKDSQLQQLSDKTPAIEDIQDEILNNFSLISDYPVFNQKMQTLTQQYNTHIRITDIYGKVLYDSDNSEEIGKTTELSSQMYGLSVNESTEGNSRYSFSVILDNQIVGTVFLTYNEYWVVENAIRKILTLLFLCLSL